MKSNERSSPHPLSRKLLRWFLRSDLAEEVQGDLDEKFNASLSKQSLFQARMQDWLEVLHYLRPFAIRKSGSFIHLSQLTMLQNYFKIGWRNMTRQKMYSAIKVGGFALGIAACIFIALFIRHELSYDQNLPKGDRMYRVVEVYDNLKGKAGKGTHLPAPFAGVLTTDFSDVEQVARVNPVALFGAGSNDIRTEEQIENTYESEFAYADPTLLDMFDIRFVYGNARTALSNTNSIVISRRKADKYFPDQNPIGKIMIVNNETNRPYTVGGVMENMPENSHMAYDFLITLTNREFGQGEQTNWLQSNYHTYVLVKAGTSVDELEKKLLRMGPAYYLPRLESVGYPNAKEEIKFLSYELQPVSDIYLNTEGVSDGLNHGDKQFVMLSGGIALFVLIIAGINFINLSTAKSANRAKEVGLRKVLGSYRINLINQFLSESILYSILAFVVAMTLVVTLMPYFNSLVGKQISLPWGEWWFVPGLLSGVLLIGLVAGAYPSFYLSVFKPVDVLKGNIARGSKNAYTRSMLVIFQFTTSIILIIGTFIIHRQMDHILNTKIGFDKEQVVLLQGTNLLGDKVSTFKEELLRSNHVKSVSVSDYLPVQGTKRNGNGFSVQGRKNMDQSVGGQFWIVDADYNKTLGIKILQGRDFSQDMASDSNAVIINEAMARSLNLTDPIGKSIENYRAWNVIGVVEDFTFNSVREKVEPLCMALGSSPSIISVKLADQNVAEAIASITASWKAFAPQQPLRYTFLDERYARTYDDIQRMEKIFTTFALLAVVVACLGLFGLSSFMVEQRSKEISIRLVLGASVNSIFRLITHNFVKLVLISFVIAVPIAWYMMDLWLQEFVLKVPITADVFILAGVIALVIAMATISYQALHASNMKPVDNLKAD